METIISQRLHDVADFIPKGSILLDVGSDHAYLPLYALEQGLIKRAIAGEVVKGPYQAALDNVQRYGYQDQVEVRLADGLAAFSSSDGVDTIAICGMGGRLIADILDQGADKLSAINRLILQPNNCEDDLRRWLSQHGFEVVAERLMTENQKFYEILVAEHGHQALSDQELRFGPHLMKERSAIFVERWSREADKLEAALKQVPKERQDARQLIQSKIDAIKEVVTYES